MKMLQAAVMTGDSGKSSTFIIIGIVCVVAIIAVVVLGCISKKK